MNKNDPDKYFETFRHIRTKKHGNITVALKVFPNKQDMLVGFAFCSPNEKNFCKRKGRQISSDRLQSKPMLVEMCPEKTIVYALLHKLTKINDSDKKLLYIPQWINGLLKEKGFYTDEFGIVKHDD